MIKKGAFEISFGWLFALIIGGVILFLAILIATKVINIGRQEVGAETGKEIGVLLNPLEIGFETAKSTSFSIATETKIMSKCEEQGAFGKQSLRLSQKTLGKWEEAGISASFYNKYIFSNESEGKMFYVFSKPFEFPFKVADLIYLSSSKEEYCFIDSPSNIQDELEALGQDNIKLDEENCSDKAIKICFASGSDCNIYISYSGGKGILEKGSENLEFGGDALMYAAIFSDKELYECQLSRLMKRTKELAMLYKDKSIRLKERGCESGLNGDLDLFIDSLNDFNDNRLTALENIAEDLKIKNSLSECALW
jgi:hypothetical protein